MSFLNALPFNWFDIVVLIVLFLGFSRGRKRGMSEELMPVIKWLLVIAGAAFAYQPIGDMLSQNSQVITQFWGYMIGYCGAALVIASLFALVTKMMGGKLVGSDVFGRNEYYLGMVAGSIRFACILITILALMNARQYRTFEVTAEQPRQQELYGSNFFPTFQQLQSQVF